MYDLTLLSIFRDSTGYLERYAAQVAETLTHFENVHLIWVEGDSVDDTQAQLQALSERLAADVTLVEFTTSGPHWPSIDHPSRWQQLEACWNRALKHLEPGRLCVCVESDLMWDWSALSTCIEHLTSWDVVYPMLMRRLPEGEYFYDTNGFSRNGQHFSNFAPFIPDWDGVTRLVELTTGGGLIATRYDYLRQARWRDKCVLHFPDQARLAVDTWTKIYHP